jgi:hypothetical protein
MSIPDFKNAIVALILMVLGGADKKVKELEADKATLIGVVDAKNAEISALRTENDDLKTQLGLAQQALTDDEANDKAALDEAFNAIKEQFAPSESTTPVTDEMVKAVEQSPVVETPAAIVTDATAGTATETPTEVKEAAVEAVIDAVIENETEPDDDLDR